MRAAIIATAQRFFMQQGIRATTMDQIAEALGISKKTLYEHFISKEALVAACAEALLDQMEAKMQELRQKHHQDILAAMTAIANYAYGTLTSLNPVLFSELRRLLPHLRLLIIPRIQQIILRHLSLSLEQGIQEGVFRPDLPKDFIPPWVSYVMLHVVLNPTFAEQVQRSVAEIYAETLLLLLYSFCTEKGRQALEAYKPLIRQTYVR
ncbi:MAG: TetR/AcrR family transcriptional regulator [Bacteroidia bacterium]|nr:TetR/AcrR family transcriptional regulator [Bacteroidia bacterium]MDW8088260.1 TetR/AcrR family transcriptional regulator [Bacteroidia bacterium]